MPLLSFAVGVRAGDLNNMKSDRERQREQKRTEVCHKCVASEISESGRIGAQLCVKYMRSCSPTDGWKVVFTGAGALGCACSCGQRGHMARECTARVNCRMCGQEGHYTRECPRNGACTALPPKPWNCARAVLSVALSHGDGAGWACWVAAGGSAASLIQARTQEAGLFAAERQKLLLQQTAGACACACACVCVCEGERERERLPHRRGAVVPPLRVHCCVSYSPLSAASVSLHAARPRTLRPSTRLKRQPRRTKIHLCHRWTRGGGVRT
jgi:hypothetical protein